MSSPDRKSKARQEWIRTYEKTVSVSIAARKCGIARSTLYRWLKRYQEEGFSDRSRRPHKYANQKFDDDIENLILDIRDRFNYGKLRISSHLFHNHQLSVSPSTVGRVLKKYAIPRVKCFKNPNYPIRYAKEIPGERIQIDVCKITTGIYQYTAIDDCSRFRVMYTYRRRTAKNSINFLERLLEQMPFPIQRIQTDRGNEFFAHSFQKKLKEYGIKFRPIKPRSPHLNGKVERSHQTDLREFYMTADLKDKKLNDLLEQWQFHYNWHRPHSSLNGKSPIDILAEKTSMTPCWEDISTGYIPENEPFRIQNYQDDLKNLRILKKQNSAILKAN